MTSCDKVQDSTFLDQNGFWFYSFWFVLCCDLMWCDVMWDWNYGLVLILVCDWEFTVELFQRLFCDAQQEQCFVNDRIACNTWLVHTHTHTHTIHSHTQALYTHTAGGMFENPTSIRVTCEMWHGSFWLDARFEDDDITWTPHSVDGKAIWWSVLQPDGEG